MSRGRGGKQRLAKHKRVIPATREFVEWRLNQHRMYELPILLEAYLEAKKYQRWYRRALRFVWGLPGRAYQWASRKGPEVNVVPMKAEENVAA